MKIFLILIIIMSFGGLGFLLKQRYKNEYEFLLFVSDFENFYNSNMTLFKNDFVEIIDNFKITQKNKNAKFIKLFSKNNNIYSFDEEIFEKYILNDADKTTIKKYFFECAKNEYEFEKEKNKNFERFISSAIQKSQKNVNEKGTLLFKILLAIGAIVGIVIW